MRSPLTFVPHLAIWLAMQPCLAGAAPQMPRGGGAGNWCGAAAPLRNGPALQGRPASSRSKGPWSSTDAGEIVVELNPDPALAASRNEGQGSRFTRVSLPDGRKAVLRKGDYVKVDLAYHVNSPKGLFPHVVPLTHCSMTYDALAEPLLKSGKVQMGFTVGAKCLVKHVKVTLTNHANVVVFQDYINVSLEYVD